MSLLCQTGAGEQQPGEPAHEPERGARCEGSLSGASSGTRKRAPRRSPTARWGTSGSRHRTADQDPKRPRAARAPTTIPRKHATITGCVETSETVRWRSLAAAGSSASPASSSRCSSKIRSAVVNQRGSRSPRRLCESPKHAILIRRRFWTRRRARASRQVRNVPADRGDDL